MSLRRLLVPAALLAAALLLRLYGLASVPFWCDEAYTALTATAASPLKSLLAIEHSPPLYYWFLMSTWSGWGTSELWFRIPSVAASLGMMLLAWRLGRDLAGRSGAIWAFAFCAASAYLVTHAREARGYMVAGFFSFWAIVEMVEVVRSSSRNAWARMGLAMLAACYTHYVQVVVCAACAVVVVAMRPERRSWKGLGFILAGGLAAFIPWFSFLRTQIFHDTFYSGVWQGQGVAAIRWMDGLHYLNRLGAWALCYNLPPHLYARAYVVLPATFAFASVILLRPCTAAEQVRRTCLAAAGVLLFFVGVLWTIRAVGEPVYVLALFPLVYTLLGAAVAAGLKQGRARALLALAMAAVFVLASLGGVREMQANRFHLEDRLTRDPWPELTTWVRERTGPGDAVVVVPGWPSPGAWYFGETSRVNLFQVWVPTPYFRRTAPYAGLTVGAPLVLARDLTESHAGLALCRFRPGHYPHEAEFFGALRAGRRLAEQARFGRIEVELLVRVSGADSAVATPGPAAPRSVDPGDRGGPGT